MILFSFRIAVSRTFFHRLDVRAPEDGSRGMTEEYKPKYLWKPTWPGQNGLDGKPLQDFQGWHGETPVGRIRPHEL